MTRTTLIPVGLALLLAPAIARAEETDDQDDQTIQEGTIARPDDDPYVEVPPEVVPSSPRLEALAGIHAGNLPVQGADLVSLGFDLEAGVRFDRLAVLAEADLLWLPDSTDSSGSGHRFGLNVNYTIMQGIGAWRRPRHGYPQFPVRARADLWLTAGFGEETMHTNIADLSRRDVSFGIGGHIGEEDRNRHWAPFAAFFTLRSVVARDPDPFSGTATRGDVHDMGGTGALDFAFWFDFGVMFGG